MVTVNQGGVAVMERGWPNKKTLLAKSLALVQTIRV